MGVCSPSNRMPTALGSCSFQSTTDTDILLYCKSLTTSIKNNHALVEPPFCSTLPEDKDRKHHTPQPGGFVYWKRYLQKNSLQPHWKGPYQVLLTNPCKTPRSRLLDPHVTLKEGTEPQMDHLVT